MLGKLIYPTIKEMIEQRDFSSIKDALGELPPSDIAELLEDIDEAEDRALIFRLLPHEVATPCFEYMSVEAQQELLEGLGTEKVRRLLEDMSPDDRTALLEELPAEVTLKLLNLLSPEERREAQALLAYPEESVGRLMTPDFIHLFEDQTVEAALQTIRRVGIRSETVYDCYVTDRDRKLMGVVSLKDLVLADPDTRVAEVMDHNIQSTRTDEDREQAVRLSKRYDLLALPVVDRDNRIVGIVTVDDLMDVLVDEATEDIQMLGGVLPSEETYMSTTIWQWVWRRSVWLVILLFAGLLTALVLHKFDSTLQAVIALTFFIPALTSTGGNTGSQASVLVIRALALGEVKLVDILKIVQKEIVVGLILALLLGFLLYLVVFITGTGGGARFAFAIAMGLGTVVFVSNLVGAVMPIILKAVGLDPALTSAPFIATIIDVVGLMIYLQIAVHLLQLSG